jgi:DNA-binding NarL/FixJ family response regulator
MSGWPYPWGASVAPVSPLRVVVAEDQMLLREGLSRLLADAGFDVVAQAADADDLRRKVAAHRPDVAIVDVQMPPDHTDDGLRAAIEIRRTDPDIGILMLSQFRDEAYALDLIGENAQGVGYLLKDRVADVDSFADAVRRVARGGSALDPEIVALMVGRRRKHDPLGTLTPREHQVLTLMAEGKSNRGIAESLNVTVAAVEKHVGRIFGKLGLADEPLEHRRVLAVLTLLRAR